MNLPCDDDSAGLAEYADVVVHAIGDRGDLVLVAQSFGGFTASLVCERMPVDLMVLVAAMIPSPGEAANDYWTNTGWQPAEVDSIHQPKGIGRQDAETIASFMHDVPFELALGALERVRNQSETPGMKPWPLEAWPEVPRSYCSVATIVSSPQIGCAGWQRNAWGSFRMRSTAVIVSPSAGRGSSHTGSWRTCRIDWRRHHTND
jgi:hypothetical protein